MREIANLKLDRELSSYSFEVCSTGRTRVDIKLLVRELYKLDKSNNLVAHKVMYTVGGLGYEFCGKLTDTEYRRNHFLELNEKGRHNIEIKRISKEDSANEFSDIAIERIVILKESV